MKNQFRGMSIKPETAQEIKECAEIQGMRKRITEYGYRGDALTRNVLESARYQGLSGDDTMTWLAFEALKRAEQLEDMVLSQAMLRPPAPIILDSLESQSRPIQEGK